MPAHEEELKLALEDGVEFKELLSPIKYSQGIVNCEVMKLGEPDESGRRTPVPQGQWVEVPADLVISAVGEQIEESIFIENNIQIDNHGKAVVDKDTLKTNVERVYVAGDGLYGPSTVVDGIAQAARFARAVVSEEMHRDLKINTPKSHKDIEKIENKRGILEMGHPGGREGGRCLQCSTVCEACVDVCPNCANISVKVKGNKMHQIIHVDRMCNECGNCETFCPYSSAPYREKFTLFSTEGDFQDSKNDGFIVVNKHESIVKVRLEDKVLEVKLKENHTRLPKDIENILWAIITDYSYVI